ncbi:uncharacterized protein LOC108039882 [Drosophila rhopaloa]|uniref:Uncharacterized protein LOC108039882 n=1 Tax=Drosophila rhopaloa TaxID=1041015 RepID=A0A6P4E7L3_DRORH|nr:uncharacterized protein LOC108039882 [Drosophila rhopaloa]
MNALVALVLLLAIGPLFVYSDAIQKSLEECAKKNHVTPDVLKINPPDYKVKCYYYCHFVNEKVIVNDKIELPGLDSAKPCLNIKDDNKCELAFKLRTCLRTHLPEHIWQKFA